MPVHTKDSLSVLVFSMWVLALTSAAWSIATGLPSPLRPSAEIWRDATTASSQRLSASPGGRHRANRSRDSAVASRGRDESRLEAVRTAVLVSLHMKEPPSPEVIAHARATLSAEDVARAKRTYDEAVAQLHDSQTRIPAGGPSTSTHTPRRKATRHHETDPTWHRRHFDRHSRPVTLFFSSGSHASHTGRAREVFEGRLSMYFSPIPDIGHSHDHTGKKRRRRRKRKAELTCSVYSVHTDNATLGGTHGEPSLSRELRLLDSQVLAEGSPGWKTFLVTEAVQSWLDNPRTDLVLVVDVRGHSAEDMFYLDQDSPGAGASRLQPRVDVLYEEPTEAFRRERRQVGASSGNDYDCTPEDGVTTCCRYHRTITYSDLGWDRWIIQPSSYVSNQCSGSCPKNYRSATPYSRAKSLMHEIDSDDWNPPCCSPTEFSHTAYFYINGTGGLQVALESNAIVDVCKCL